MRVLLACAWLAAAVVGLRALWAYAARPGQAEAGPVSWPADSALAHDSARPTLLMFLHPMCPCSRASVEELSRVLSRTGTGTLSVQVIAVRPHGAPETWESSDLVRAIRVLPGVELSFDRTGKEARRFGAHTSGHAALYDRDGALLFSGGITPSRGHSGDNSGADSIVELVHKRLNTRDARKPVYGCELPAPPIQQR